MGLYLGISAIIENEPMKKDDLQETFAEIALARREYGFEPKTPLSEGVPLFVDWFKRFHRL